MAIVDGTGSDAWAPLSVATAAFSYRFSARGTLRVFVSEFWSERGETLRVRLGNPLLSRERS